MSSSPQVPLEQVVKVRRAPRYGVFTALGAALGVVAAMILATVFDGTSEASPYTQVDYSLSQAFGFIMLWCVPAGILLAMLIALLLDRTVGRRSRDVTAVHELVVDEG
ncbi:potassium transporter Trk [Microbacterium album]|nr:potassium transporter Trk [Microbacterium album]